MAKAAGLRAKKILHRAVSFNKKIPLNLEEAIWDVSDDTLGLDHRKEIGSSAMEHVSIKRSTEDADRLIKMFFSPKNRGTRYNAGNSAFFGCA